MKTNHFSNEDVTYFTELNFDIDEWTKAFGGKFTKEILVTANKYFRAAVAKRFVLEKGPMGRKWKKLSPLTIMRKQGSARKLFFTGKLQESITSTIYGDELTISTDQVQAKILQFGTRYETTPKQSYWMWHNLFDKQGHPFKTRHIFVPARPFFGFAPGDARTVENWIRVKIKETERMGTYELV